MKYAFKIINYFFQSIFVYLFFIIGRLLGLKMSRKIFATLFSIIGPIFKSKRIIINNLNLVSKKLPNYNEQKIIRNMWKNFGMTFIEYIFLDYFKKNNTYVTIKDEGNLSQIIKENKPVIFISGHFANFELMSMEISKKKIPLATIYRPLNNIFLNPFMEYLRKKYICTNQIKKGIKGVRESLKFFNQGTSIAIMIDQRVSEGEKINFFNYPAYTTTIPKQFAKKFRCKIQPVHIERYDKIHFKVLFDEQIVVGENTDEDSISLKLNQWLEKKIKKNPTQWIWSHDRWK